MDGLEKPGKSMHKQNPVCVTLTLSSANLILIVMALVVLVVPSTSG